MATVRDAVAAFGLDVRDGEDLVVVEATGGAFKHYPVSANPDRPLVESSQWYIAGGGYRPGSVQRGSGRTRDNLVSARLLSFDFDLADLLDEPADDVYGWDDGEILSYEESHVRAVDDVLGRVGLPIHILAHTGHGLVAVVRIADASPDALPAIVEAYKAIVARVNTEAGMRLADPAVTDAGTRLIRVPGTLNLKGVNARPVRLLRSNDGALTVEQLVAIAGVAQSRRKPDLRIVPNATDKDLQEAQADRIATALMPLWVEGDRNSLAVAVAGEAAKAGVTEESCLALVERMCVDAADNEIDSRIKTVKRTYRLHLGGSTISGWMRLRDIVPAAVADLVDKTFDEVRQSQAVKLRVGTRIASSTKVDPVERFESSFSVTPFPEDAWYGWFREYRDIAVPTTEAAEQFHLGSALATVGAMVGRKVSLDFGDGLFVNQFVLLLGLSGSSKKDTAIKRAISLPGIRERVRRTAESPFYNLARNVISGEGLIAMLSEQPNQLVYISEINKLLSIAQRKGAGGVLDTLLESWDTPPVLEVNSIRARADKGSRAVAPFVSVIAAGQPGRFADMIRDEDIFSGFANRWLYLPGVGGLNGKLAREGALDDDDAVRLYEALRRTIATYEAFGSAYKMPMTPEAEQLNKEWYDRINRSKGHDEAEASMRERHQVIGLKIATVYAITDGARHLDRPHLEAAITLVEWSWENVRRMMRVWGVSVMHKLERRILDVLETRGPMTRRALQGQCGSRMWTSIEFARALDSLIRNDMVVVAGTLLGLPDDE